MRDTPSDYGKVTYRQESVGVLVLFRQLALDGVTDDFWWEAVMSICVHEPILPIPGS